MNDGVAVVAVVVDDDDVDDDDDEDAKLHERLEVRVRVFSTMGLVSSQSFGIIEVN